MNEAETLTEASLDSMLATALVFLPKALAALALLALGWLLAHLLRVGARRLIGHVLERLSNQRLARARAIDARTRQSPAFRSAPAVVGAIVYWTVLLLFVAAAVEALGLSAVSSVVALVTAYLPRVLVAVLVLLVGFWAGEFLRHIIARTAGEVGYAGALARSVQVLTLLVFLVIAIDQLGIDSTILVMSLTVFFAATLGAAALAFGLGARTVVSNLIATRYVRRNYATGDTVAVGEVNGRILEITDTAVIIDGPQGQRVMVPAQRFLQEVSTLLAGGGS